MTLAALETYRGGFPIHSITGRWIDRLRHAPGGLHRDGWAAARMEWMVPPGREPIRIRGLAPAAMRLSITANGHPAGDHSVAAGAFCVSIEEPALARLEVRASPRDGASSESSRDRAWVVRGIGRDA